MVILDSVVKLSNSVVPYAGKESKAGCGYRKSYKVIPAYSKEGMDALFD